MAYNKVVYGNKVLIDLTSDTVEAKHVLKGKSFHNKNGTKGIGTLESTHLPLVTDTVSGVLTVPDVRVNFATGQLVVSTDYGNFTASITSSGNLQYKFAD